jgi:hypothetical protein
MSGDVADNPAVLADHDAVRIGVNLDRTPDRAGGHRVPVVVKAHQAGLRDRGRHRVEAIEPADINELRSLRLEHIPDRLPGMMRLGVGDTFIEQPGVHLLVGLEPQPRAGLPAFSRMATAQTYPSRPVRIIVGPGAR